MRIAQVRHPDLVVATRSLDKVGSYHFESRLFQDDLLLGFGLALEHYSFELRLSSEVIRLSIITWQFLNGQVY